MADEVIELSVTPERIDPKDANFRRNSTGRTSITSREKILPHYLRASTSSCHDFCKYGRQHAFEAKGKRPTLKKTTAVASEVPNREKTVTTLSRHKKLVVRPKPSSEPKTNSPDKPRTDKREVKTPSQEISSFSRKLDDAARPEGGDLKPASSSFKRLGTAAKPANGVKPKLLTTKLSEASPSNTSGGVSRRRSSGIGIVNKTTSPKVSVKKSGVPLAASLSPKPPVSGASSLNSRRAGALKVSPSKKHNMVRQAELKLPSADYSEEKTLFVVEPKPEMNCLPPSINGSPSPPSVQGSRSPPSMRRSSSSRSPSLRGSRSPSISGSHSSRYSGTSSYSSSSYSLSTDEESTLSKGTGSASSKQKETQNGNLVPTPKNKYRRTRTGMAQTEDKDSGRKLKFRRGKVVDPQDESNGSRRLRFKQGRVLGDNEIEKAEFKRRSFRKRREVGDTNGTKPESEKVVLRHQDVQDKKDAQGLLNNVIEEAASKLVETRKSKVKALVGAFETVISLHDTKPPAPSNG